ncbi:MAG: hypothetical protein ACTSRU_20115, partial [Candidatus Hodarchaeales archaeon]
MKKLILTVFVVVFAVNLSIAGSIKSVTQWNAEVPKDSNGNRILKIDSNNKLQLSSGLNCDEDVDIDFDANDEEVNITSSQGYGTAGYG